MLESHSIESGYTSEPETGVDDGNRLRQAACDEYFIARRDVPKPVWFN
jgi:hypothetical protein